MAALPLAPELAAEINARSNCGGVPVDQFENSYFVWLGAGEYAHAAEGALCAPRANVDEASDASIAGAFGNEQRIVAFKLCLKGCPAETLRDALLESGQTATKWIP